MKVYLAHPFLDMTYGRELQAKIEALGITVLNPFQRNEQAVYEAIIANKEVFGATHSRNIVEGDLRLIEQVDAVVAICNDKASIGTHMEVFYASRILRRKVFVLYQKSFPVKVHPWYEYLAMNYSTEAELLTALESWVK